MSSSILWASVKIHKSGDWQCDPLEPTHSDGPGEKRDVWNIVLKQGIQTGKVACLITRPDREILCNWLDEKPRPQLGAITITREQLEVAAAAHYDVEYSD